MVGGEGGGTAPVFTVDIHDDGAELLPARLRTQPWRGASWPPLTRTIRTQHWLVAALLSSSAPRHPDIQPSDKYPGQCLPRHSRMLTGKMPVRCTRTGLMTRGWGLVTKIDSPATFGSRRQQEAAGGSRRGQEAAGAARL